ncbi:MAG: sodium-dependent bicarbonate transport family permease [Bacteroidetes bacterium]|nr:sodium-dependent bicarbonate transport family permease [Bacteroidota bacterium]
MLQNLLDPVILLFVLGLIAGLLKTELKLPEAIYDALSIYLLLAIGFKGGIELSKIHITDILLPVAGTLVLGIVIPLIAFLILRKLGKLNVPNSAAIAAHYGSVSAVTFAVAIDFLINSGVKYDEYMTVLLVMLEIPAISIGIMLARYNSKESDMDFKTIFREVFLGKSIYLLIGGLIIGYFAGIYNKLEVSKLFIDLFKGFLAFFLLEMGIIASKRFKDFRRTGVFIISFAVVMPVISAMLGIFAGLVTGLSLGGTFILACLAASASYIAAPTAMRIAVPEANPTLYITASLGITFPFNIIFGIQLYYIITEFIFKTFK